MTSLQGAPVPAKGGATSDGATSDGAVSDGAVTDGAVSGRVLMLVWTGVSTDTRVLREARTLVDEGWSVHIIGRAVPSDFVAPQGISVSSVGVPPSAQGRTRKLNVIERAGRWLMLPEHVGRRLGAWQRDALVQAREHRADVVHAHDFSALPVGAELAQEWGVPLVYDSHELWSGRPRVGRPTPWKARREARLEARLGAGAAIVLTVGDGVADALRERYGWPQVRVVRNTFPRAQPREPRIGGPSGAVYAGRIAPYRELEVIAKASRSIDLPITLIGPTDAEFLARFDPGRARIRDSLPADEVDAVLADAGLALVTHSDKWENHRLALPNKLFHAVRAGVPVVATDVGELARTVREYDLGELYRPGDAADMVRAIERAVARYDELQVCVRTAERLLSWETDGRVLLDAYIAIRASPSGAVILGRHTHHTEEDS
jgi:glycogen(starch) synthase